MAEYEKGAFSKPVPSSVTRVPLAVVGMGVTVGLTEGRNAVERVLLEQGSAVKDPTVGARADTVEVSLFLSL